MKSTKVLEERVRRATVILKEIGLTLKDEQKTPETYSCEIEDKENFCGSLFIDLSNKFLEVAYSYTFSQKVVGFLKSNMEEVMKICYEFGCYHNLFQNKGNVTFSIFTKEYYAGLNYYSLRDNLKDFSLCNKLISKIIDFAIFKKASKGGEHENS